MVHQSGCGLRAQQSASGGRRPAKKRPQQRSFPRLTKAERLGREGSHSSDLQQATVALCNWWVPLWPIKAHLESAGQIWREGVRAKLTEYLIVTVRTTWKAGCCRDKGGTVCPPG